MEKLLALLPEQTLLELAIETRVDYKAKKLQGEVIFKLLLYCLLTTKECSLRTMESAYESVLFAALNATYAKEGGIRYNSISERLSTIKPDYFCRLYAHCIKAYKDTLGAEETGRLLRFDSTIVALSGALLKVGYELKGGDAAHLRHLKFTIGLSDIPESAHFYADQSHNSENTALKESILQHKASNNLSQAIEPGASPSIYVFDRGISSRVTYDLLSAQHIRYVSRINPGAKHKVLKPNRLTTPLSTGRLSIEEDIDVQLFGDASRGSASTSSYIRCIKAKQFLPKDSKSKNNELWFITNIGPEDLSAEQVCETYRRRWDIEAFFKFLKQHLNFSHLLSRSENGIKVVLYTTLIAATMVMAYRKLAGLTGYKIVKQQLAQMLETEILKTIISLCGGNPELLQQILKFNSS